MAEAVQRKLAAILAADVAGYSRLMGEDEEATLATLKAYREVIDRLIDTHQGRVFGGAGDSLIAEFASPVEAVRCANEIQLEIDRRNTDLPEDRRMRFRIGVNLGDVMVEGDNLYGDGVNVAARLQTLAEPGGICISRAVFDQVKMQPDLGFEYLGEQRVKNISEPVPTYRVLLEPQHAGKLITAKKDAKKRSKVPRWAIPAAATVVVLGVAAGVLLTLDEDPILALPSGPRIAVLPFDNLSGNPEQDYFADGVTEEIITELSRFRELFVISGETTFQYKGQPVDVRDIGQELRLQYLLEGSIRRAADTIRVTAQLIDVETGTHLWAETYDRDLTAADIFAIQDDITEKVVTAIGGAWGVIAQSDVARARRSPPENLQAYECVLLTGEFDRVFTPEAHERARDCLEKAVELDPNYGGAQTSLGYLYSAEFSLGMNPRPNSLERARDAAQKGVALEPDDAFAHSILAQVHLFRGEREAFLAEAERALSLNPNNTVVTAAMAQRFAFMGEWERGVALMEKAQALSPKHPPWSYIPIYLNHYRKGEYEQALAVALQSHMPDFWVSHVNLAAIYGQLEREEDAREAVANVLRLNPGHTIEKSKEAWRTWSAEESFIEDFAEGLRNAGLPE
ncbi:MAG: adenylate/guanylate cyclase domain-containing protein [Alphaproteobacteria bacterium]